MKSITPFAFLAWASMASSYTRFTKFEDCVAYCDQNPSCQSAFFDTISGDCQDHDCIYGETPPDRFKSYIKSTATEYCPGTSPTATMVKTSTNPTKSFSISASTSTSTSSGISSRHDHVLLLAGVSMSVICLAAVS
jgi:hypothetical protein